MKYIGGILRGARSVVLGVLASGTAHAAELYRQDDVVVRWDNTLKYSAAWRIAGADPTLIRDPNGDDGDRNFPPGLISNRVDVLSELGLAFGRWGAEVSAAGWYDFVYNQTITPDRLSPPSLYPLPTTFAPAVRDLHGRQLELLNGFAYGTFEVKGAPLTVRIGRHTDLWGESLFFANNGIAAGQAPVDAIKAASVPGVRAQEVYMPVAQASANYQPRPDILLAAYYQFEWRKTRLPGSGSYFSSADFLDAGGYRLYVAQNQYLTRIADGTPPSSGQFGLSARFSGGAVDWGLYVVRFNAHDPQIYLRPQDSASPLAGLAHSVAYGYTPGIVGGKTGTSLGGYPFGAGLPPGAVGAYQLVYPTGIEIYGASFDGYIGSNSVAGEISLRRNMPFVSTALIVPHGWDGHDLYPYGDSLHTQLSMNTTLAPGALWRTADLSIEIAANHRLHVSENTQVLDPGRTPFAAAVRILFEPRYFAVIPGLDLSLPISFGHGVVGRSSTDSSQERSTGDITFGISAVYRAVWQATVSMTYFLGPPNRQPFADRNFISLSLQRTF